MNTFEQMEMKKTELKKNELKEQLRNCMEKWIEDFDSRFEASIGYYSVTKVLCDNKYYLSSFDSLLDRLDDICVKFCKKWLIEFGACRNNPMGTLESVEANNQFMYKSDYSECTKTFIKVCKHKKTERTRQMIDKFINKMMNIFDVSRFDHVYTEHSIEALVLNYKHARNLLKTF
jgi:hypothetical protein